MKQLRIIYSDVKRIAFPCLCLMLLAVTSCQREAAVRSALARAEAVMEENPQEARLILDSLSHEIVNHPNRQSIVNRKSSNRKSDLALWALLRTQAEHKCHVRAKSDSLPLIATRYYGTKRKTQRAALAQHYLGCAYSDMGRDLEAMDALLRASTLFPDTTNKYFANNLFELGIIYTSHHMNDSAWVAFSRYRQTDACNSDSVNIGYADYYMGSVALYNGNDDVADSLFRCVEQNTTCSSYIHHSTYFQLAKLYYHRKHDIEGAVAYLDKLGDYFGPENGAVLSLKADILADQQQPALAYELHKKAIRNSPDIYTQCSSYERLASIAPLLNKPDSTQYFIERYKNLLDTIYVQNKQKELTEVKDKHIVEMEQQRLENEHRRWIWTLSLAALALIIVVLVVLVWSLNLANRKKKAYIHISDQLKKAKMQEERQKIELAKAQEEADRLKTAYQDALQQRNAETPGPADYESRIRICADQFRKGLSWAMVLRYLHGSALSLQKDERAAIRHDLNVCFADYYDLLQAKGKKVNQTEKMVSACYILGFKAEETEEILGYSDSTVRVQKYRLKEKLPDELYQLIFSFPLQMG